MKSLNLINMVEKSLNTLTSKSLISNQSMGAMQFQVSLAANLGQLLESYLWSLSLGCSLSFQNYCMIINQRFWYFDRFHFGCSFHFEAMFMGQMVISLSITHRLEFQQPSCQFFDHMVQVGFKQVQVPSSQVYHRKSFDSHLLSVYSSRNHTIWRTRFYYSWPVYFQVWYLYGLYYVADSRIELKQLVR